MAGAVAEAGAAEEAAESLSQSSNGPFYRLQQRDDAVAGCTHAPVALPQRRFAHYCAVHMAIPSRRPLPRRKILRQT
jgi:hypothetical protein